MAVNAIGPKVDLNSGSVSDVGLAGWQLRRVTEFAEEHLAQDFGLKELAGLVSLS